MSRVLSDNPHSYYQVVQKIRRVGSPVTNKLAELTYGTYVRMSLLPFSAGRPLLVLTVMNQVKKPASQLISCRSKLEDSFSRFLPKFRDRVGGRFPIGL